MKYGQSNAQVMQRFSVSPDMLPYVIAVDTFGTQVVNPNLWCPRFSDIPPAGPGIGMTHITRLAMTQITFCF